MNLTGFPTQAQFDETLQFVRDRIDRRPSVGVILGSGLSSLADDVEQAQVLSYGRIPHFASSTVHGHSGRLVFGQFAGHSVLVMQGRVHFYEGYAIHQVTYPVRIMALLGIETLVVTNAAGGLNPEWTPGDLMLIADHINLVGMTGRNPLIGPNDPNLGPRFPDMSEAYDPGLRRIALGVAESQQIPLREGVYACLSGPSFETPAEIRFLRMIGADAVGMSTAPEVIVARHMGLGVLGISGISNVHATDPLKPRETSHEEVLATGKIIAPRLIALIRGVLEQL